MMKKKGGQTMEKRLSRRKERRAVVLTALVIVLGLLGKFVGGALLLTLFCVVLVVWFAGVMENRKCPYCGKVTRRGIYWSKPDAGYCWCCGKLMKFDDVE